MLKFLRETVKRIAGVFTLSRQMKDLDMAQALDHSSLVGTTFLYNVSCPGCDVNRFRDVYFLLASNYPQLSKSLNSNLGLKHALSSSVCNMYGFSMITNDNDVNVCPGFHLVEFYATLFGTSRIMALCNVIGIEAGRWTMADSHLVLPPWQERQDLQIGGVPKNGSIDDKTAIKTEGSHDDQAATGPIAVQLANDPHKNNVKPFMEENKDNNVLISDSAAQAGQKQNGIKSAVNVGGETSMILDSSLAAGGGGTQQMDKSVGTSSGLDSTISATLSTVSAIVSSSSPTSTTMTPSTSTEHVVIDPTPVNAGPSSRTNGDQSIKASAKVDKNGLRDPPDVVFVPPLAVNDKPTPPQQQHQPPPPPPNDNGGGRESVWQKLSNKIKVCVRAQDQSSHIFIRVYISL